MPDKKLHYLFGKHEVGQHKERVLLSSLGFTQETAELFRQRLLAAVAAAGRARFTGKDRWGKKYLVLVTLEGVNGKVTELETAWIVRRPGDAPSFVTLTFDKDAAKTAGKDEQDDV